MEICLMKTTRTLNKCVGITTFCFLLLMSRPIFLMSKFAFFPQWPKPKPPRDLATVVPNLESTGLDLLSDVQDLATVVLLRIKCFSMNQLKESLLGMLLSTNTSRNVRILEWYHDFDRLSSNCILVYSLIKIFKHLVSLDVEDSKDVKSGYTITFVLQLVW
ncbi:uncharacterized protein LOC109849700 isoform X5 [Asparagus officinalis]|uniref:uncharacterized protein LOC109849700 isoform X5 n=1 Tax=Asparagus officinalis TaxID=4686 RepID=UPI00098E68B0|nr:uncharacterized protein LOC109849700 isoform X5 [Asparagus officinalis]